MEEIKIEGKTFIVKTLKELIMAEVPNIENSTKTKKLLFVAGSDKEDYFLQTEGEKVMTAFEHCKQELVKDKSIKENSVFANLLQEGTLNFGYSMKDKSLADAIKQYYTLGFAVDVKGHAIWQFKPMYEAFGKDKSFIITPTIDEIMKYGKQIVKSCSGLPDLLSEKVFVTAKWWMKNKMTNKNLETIEQDTGCGTKVLKAYLSKSGAYLNIEVPNGKYAETILDSQGININRPEDNLVTVNLTVPYLGTGKSKEKALAKLKEARTQFEQAVGIGGLYGGEFNEEEFDNPFVEQVYTLPFNKNPAELETILNNIKSIVDDISSKGEK